MTEQTRYRVTGAVFLIAVAVIVLPMLFDGEGLKTTDVPPPSPETITPVEVPEIKPQPDATFERSQELRESVDEEGFAKDNDTRIGQPVLSDTDAPQAPGIGAAFGVQLASFTDRANAVALRDRARADGYPAFLSEAKQSAQKLTRVAVGPYIDRKEAEQLRDELSTRYSVKAIVVGFAS
jgi:DedD protein